jgi:hypothetical protein
MPFGLEKPLATGRTSSLPPALPLRLGPGARAAGGAAPLGRGSGSALAVCDLTRRPVGEAGLLPQLLDNLLDLLGRVVGAKHCRLGG